MVLLDTLDNLRDSMFTIAQLPDISAHRIQHDDAFIREHEKLAREPHPQLVFLRNDEGCLTFLVHLPRNELVPNRERLHDAPPIHVRPFLQFEGV